MLKTLDSFTIDVQERIGMNIMQAMLFEGFYKVSDMQADCNHLYDIKFDHKHKRFEVYKLSRDLEKWVLVYQTRGYVALSLAIHLGMKAFRYLDLAKIDEMNKQGWLLPDIDKLPKIAV